MTSSTSPDSVGFVRDQPVGVLLVKRRPRALEHPLIGRVANELMGEPIADDHSSPVGRTSCLLGQQIEERGRREPGSPAAPGR